MKTVTKTDYICTSLLGTSAVCDQPRVFKGREKCACSAKCAGLEILLVYLLLLQRISVEDISDFYPLFQRHDFLSCIHPNFRYPELFTNVTESICSAFLIFQPHLVFRIFQTSTLPTIFTESQLENEDK